MLLNCINPATKEIIGQVQRCTAQDYEQIVASAQSAFQQTNTINWGNALPLAQGIQFKIVE